MDTTVVALQNLYVAKGGTLSDVQNLNTIPDMINAIATLITSQATAAASASGSGSENTSGNENAQSNDNNEGGN